MSNSVHDRDKRNMNALGEKNQGIESWIILTGIGIISTLLTERLWEPVELEHFLPPLPDVSSKALISFFNISLYNTFISFTMLGGVHDGRVQGEIVVCAPCTRKFSGPKNLRKESHTGQQRFDTPIIRASQ